MFKDLVVKAFVRAVDRNLTAVYASERMNYEYATGTIYYDYHICGQKDVVNNLRTCHNFHEDFPFFVFALLHEIGHANTNKIEDIETDIEVRLYLQHTTDLSDTDKNDIYFALPSEFEATEWAIEYYTTHRFLCKMVGALLK